MSDDQVTPWRVTIEGHLYEADEGDKLIAERYPDGMQLRVTCTSGSQPSTAHFYLVGPRGGLRPIMLHNMTVGDCYNFALRVMDAARHIAAVERYRLERWPENAGE